MTDQERLNLLVAYSNFDNRICPQPRRWDEFWRLLGCPSQKVSPPLILSGWAFSTDREKRTRFREQLEYALKSGLLDEAEDFVRKLDPDEWHTCEERQLDWSYGNALLEDEARRQQATTKAANLLESASGPASGLMGLGRDSLAETIFLYHLMVGNQDRRVNAAQLRLQVSQIESFVDDEEFSLLVGIKVEVGAELRRITDAKVRECLFAEFLVCVEEAGKPLDRNAIEDFVADVFDKIGSP